MKVLFYSSEDSSGNVRCQMADFSRAEKLGRSAVFVEGEGPALAIIVLEPEGREFFIPGSAVVALAAATGRRAVSGRVRAIQALALEVLGRED